jgi:protein-tyrosine phosphatase
VPWINLPNGRDLADVRCGEHGDQVLRPGILLRSAAPVGPEAAAEAARLGIRWSVDLRTARERERQSVTLRAVSIHADLLADASYAGAANLGQLAAEALAATDGSLQARLVSQDLRSVMLDSYRSFASLPSARRGTAGVVQRLARDPGPFLLHCTAGKDRTGWVVAVILRILGASWDEIMADYLASGPPVLALFAGNFGSLPDPQAAGRVLAPLLGVYEEYLEAARTQAETDFGSFEGFVEHGLRIDEATIAELRRQLLSPTPPAP